MTDVYLALGSNLGDRASNLNRALSRISTIGRLQEVAPVYQSSAYGMENQPDFLNSAAKLSCKLKPEKLLERLKEIEVSLGRRKRVRWGPREIDLDIILFGNQVIQKDGLTIPHPDFHNRRFVLQPLADICPELMSPTHGLSVSELLNRCKDRTKIEKISTEWFSDELKI